MTKKTIVGALVGLSLCGCMSFNRDALWNAPLPMQNYCTYYAEDFPIGSMFVHRLDDWTRYRTRWGYELKTTAQTSDGSFILQYGWDVFWEETLSYNAFAGSESLYTMPISDSPNPQGLTGTVIRSRPIIVKTLYPERVKVGEFFTEYGQYKFTGYRTVKINGKKVKMKAFTQVNESQELVAKPYPFVYFRWNGAADS